MIDQLQLSGEPSHAPTRVEAWGATYELAVWPTGHLYWEVLRAASRRADLVAFVTRPGEKHPSAVATALLLRLEGHLIRVEEVWSWPGSELDRSSPGYLRRVYPSAPEVNAELEANSNSFDDWISPGLPEDLHFLRGDGSTLLGYIANERCVWMEMSSEEAKLVERELSERLRRALKRTGP